MASFSKSDTEKPTDKGNAENSTNNGKNHLFQPVSEEPKYAPPQAEIDPDKSKGWLKRLWPLLKSHPKILTVGIIFSILTLGTQAFVPYISRWAIDAAENGNRSTLFTTVLVIIGLAIVRAFAGNIYRSSFFKLAFNIDSDLRSHLYKHLTRLSFSFYDHTVSGEIVSRANSDIRSIQILFAFAPLGATALLVFVIAFILMLTIHVLLTLIALSMIPLVYFLGNRFRDIVFPLSWITQARLAGVATIVDESTNGAHVVKAFSAEEHQVHLLAKASKQVRWSVLETIKARARYNPLIEALPKLGMAVVLGYGGWLVLDDQVSIGTLFAFNAYVIMSLVPFRMLGFLIIQARRSAAAASRVYEIIDTPVDLKDPADAKDLLKPAGNIQFENVFFTYPTRGGVNGDVDDISGLEKNEELDLTRQEVLSGVSFTIEAGESVAIVGATGSGKSSIVRLLARFYDVTSGNIKIDGKDIGSLTQNSIHHHVGIVFDDPFLFSTTLAENIAFANPLANQEAIQNAAIRSQSHDFIMQLPDGYNTIIGERGYTLSGGQRQRIALARVFLANPTILALDDATSAVDVGTEARIHDFLKEKISDTHSSSTILIIAHRLSTIALADRILLLDDGHIIATGTHQELLEGNPRYREILTEVTKEAEIKEDTDDTMELD